MTMITAMSTKPAMAESTAAAVMMTSVRSIMTSEPMSSAAALISVPTLWFIDWPMVSTSLVTRLSTSP